MRSTVETCDERRSVADAVIAAVTRSGSASATISPATRAVRRARAAQLDEIRSAIADHEHRRLGHRSPTDWLAATTHESIGHCRSTLMLVDRLPHLPLVEAAFRDGEVAESAVRQLAQAWRPDLQPAFDRDEALLLGWARTLPHRDFSLVLDTWRRCVDSETAESEAESQHEGRELHLSVRWDGMGRLEGTLDPEGRALVRDAIRALSAPAEHDDRTLPQRRADALVDMARITLDAVAQPAPEDADGSTPRRKRNRPKVLVSIALTDLLTSRGGGVIDTQLDTITASAESIRRLCCDAGIHRYITDPLGTVVDHGRQQRTVSDLQFERLHIRDHGCRWPGCGVPAAGCDAHHAQHWLDLGETTDDNLVLLCWHHHRLLHEQHWSIEPLGGGVFILQRPDGAVHAMRPPIVGLTFHAA